MRRRHAWILLALGLAGPSRAADPPPASAVFVCTPEGFTPPGGAFQIAEHPIVAALDKAREGARVVLQPGDYEPFTIGLAGNAFSNSRTPGGTKDFPVIVEGRGRVRIQGREGDAIGIDQASPCAWITFRGLEIHAGARSGVLFYKRNDDRDHVGFAFEDCVITGDYDHVTAKGRRSRWGLWANRLRNFRFIGTTRPAEVRDIRSEHAFYIQNPQGPVLIENVIGRNLGRTFVQLTCRASDGPPGKGRFTVRGCMVENVGLAIEDGYRGGSAFTVSGRHLGLIEFEKNVFHGGRDPAFKKLKPADGVHGTGAFVAWQGGERQKNGTLVLRDNEFRMEFGCGDRPLVAISGCDTVRIIGKNVFASGGYQPALALEPLDDQGRPSGEPNGSVGIGKQIRLEGPLTLRNVDITAEGLERFDVWKDAQGGGK